MYAERFALYFIPVGDYAARNGRFTKNAKRAYLQPRAAWESWIAQNITPETGQPMIGRDFTDEDRDGALRLIPESEIRQGRAP